MRRPPRSDDARALQDFLTDLVEFACSPRRDWAGGYRRFNSQIEKGYCLVTGTDQVLHARAHRHASQLVVTACVGDGEDARKGPFVLDMDDAALLAEARKGGFWSYAAGVAYQIKTFYPIGGLVLDNYKTTLPIKKGLSSSAAICVLVARAFNRVYDLKMTTRAEMEMAYLGEILTPRCVVTAGRGCLGHTLLVHAFPSSRGRGAWPLSPCHHHE